MATTCFFEEEISDKERKEIKIELEFGRSSYYRDNLMYFRFGDVMMILDEKTGREIYDQIGAVGRYLGYDK